MLVVVTREAGRNDALRDWLSPAMTVVEVPLTTTNYRPIAEVSAELAGVATRGPFAVLAVTSARSRDYLDAARLVCARDVEVWTVGPVTSAAVATAGLAVTGEAPSATALAAHIDHGPVLVLGARQMRRELADELAARGIAVETVVCYETVPLALDDASRAVFARADAVVVGAPSAWRVLRGELSPATWVVVPGETTAAAVRADHERVLVGWSGEVAARLEALVDGERTRERPQ